MMDPEKKATWVAALRSGKFQQTQGKLYWATGGLIVKPGYCCLGVELKAVRGYHESSSMVTSCFTELDQFTSWVEPLHEDGIDINAINHLSSMNDRGQSFEAIADWIEANL